MRKRLAVPVGTGRIMEPLQSNRGMIPGNREGGGGVQCGPTSSSLLQPIVTDPNEWFAAMDKIGGDLLFRAGRKQPKAPRRKVFD